MLVEVNAISVFLMSQVKITDFREWLRNTLSPRINQAERERDKLVGEITKAINALSEYCTQLSKKADQDTEKKRENRAEYQAAKALSRLTTLISKMCKSVNIPQERNTTLLRALQRELSKIAAEASRVRTESLRQIRPYYIIDMMTFGGNIDKLRRLGEELHNFLMGRGTILKSLEELDEKMKALDKLLASRGVVSTQRIAIEHEIKNAQGIDTLLREQLMQIRQNVKMTEHARIDESLRALRTELLRTGFSRLGKPLRKLASMSERGDYPLAIEVKDSINEYLHRPFATFLDEAEGYPKLKGVMSSLAKAVSSGKLALKQREAKKVLDRSEQINSENSLLVIHDRSTKLKQLYDQSLVDQETASLVREMKTLKQRGRSNHVHENELKAELERTIVAETKANDQIVSLTREIEDFTSKVAETNVKIRLS